MIPEKYVVRINELQVMNADGDIYICTPEEKEWKTVLCPECDYIDWCTSTYPDIPYDVFQYDTYELKTFTKQYISQVVSFFLSKTPDKCDRCLSFSQK